MSYKGHLRLLVILVGCFFIFLGGQVEGATDSDNDGVPDNIDNCLYTPNGPNGGTCVGGSASGGPCTVDEYCGGGYCRWKQEDSDNNGIGDACKEDIVNGMDLVIGSGIVSSDGDELTVNPFTGWGPNTITKVEMSNVRYREGYLCW